MGKIKIKNESTPGTSDSGTTTIYVDTADKHAKTIDDAGVVTDLTSGTDPNAIHDNVAGEIDAVTPKGVPTGSDKILIEDAADSNNKKSIAISSLPAPTIAHSATTGKTANDHHNQEHALGGADHTAATLAELNALVSDATLDDSGDSRTPSAHNTSHQSGGSDAIKLDDLAIPDDNTDLNVSTSAHGLAPKLSNVATQYLDGTGAYSVPAGGGGADADAIHDNVAAEISAITEKGSPVSADLIIIEDSADSNNKKKVQLGNLPAGSADPSSWMDRAAFTDNASYINTSNDFTTDAANAVPIDITHTPNATGVYLITLDVLWSVDTGTFDQQGELVVDNGSAGTATTVRWRYRAEPKDAAGVPDDGGTAGTNQRFPSTLKYLHTTTASTAFNVIFRHMATDDGIESTIKASVLTIERWS